MPFSHLSDERILAELADRADYLRRTRGYTDEELTERGGMGLRTWVAFRRSHKDITLASFVRLLRGLGELERLEALLPPAEPTFSPEKQGFVTPPRRVRKPKAPRGPEGFRWGDEK